MRDSGCDGVAYDRAYDGKITYLELLAYLHSLWDRSIHVGMHVFSTAGDSVDVLRPA